MTERKKGLIALAVLVGVIIVLTGSAFIYQAVQKSMKPRLPAVWVQTNGQFYDQLQIAYRGWADPYHTPDDMNWVLRSEKQICDDLQFGRQIDFKNVIEYGDWNVTVVAGTLLYDCPDQQKRAIEWGLNPAAFDQFPPN